MVGLIQVQTNVLLNPLSYRMFGWRAGRAGSERTRFCGCLVGGWDGWVGSRVEYFSQMRVGLVHQNLADRAAPAGLSGSRARTPNGVTSHVFNSFNQTLDGLAPSPKSEVQPNMALSLKTRLDPTQLTQPPTKHLPGILIQCLHRSHRWDPRATSKAPH